MKSWWICPLRTFTGTQIFSSSSPKAGLQDAPRLRPDAQRRDRQQGHQVQAPGGGLHLGALAGSHLQGEGSGQPGAAGPQAPQRNAPAEVHLQKGTGDFRFQFFVWEVTRCGRSLPKSLTLQPHLFCYKCSIKNKPV